MHVCVCSQNEKKYIALFIFYLHVGSMTLEKINQMYVTMSSVTIGSTRQGQGRERPNHMNSLWDTGRQKELRDLNTRSM